MIKVAIVDDHILLRDALAGMINANDDFKVVLTASNGQEFIDKFVQSSGIDLVILDLNMPIRDGYETTAWLRENHPGTKVMILTMYDSEVSLIRLLHLGVRGFVKKDIHPQELKMAIRNVLEAGYHYSYSSTNKIASILTEKGEMSRLRKIMLSEIEISFLKNICSELTYKEIALEMNLNARTIDNYRDSLFSKLNVKSRVGLAMYAIKHGLVNL